MREYEVMIITRADLSEADSAKMTTRWEALISSDGGDIVKKDVWGVRRLAYPIQKQTRGSYVVYDVASTQSNIIELERILKLDENVLRAMVIKLADSVNVEERRLELQKQEAARKQAEVEAMRERAESESQDARRGGSSAHQGT